MNTIASRARDKQSASDMYFRVMVYSVLRTVAIAALIGIAVAVLHRVT